MNLEEAVKTGFLLVPPQSFLRKTWIKRFCAVYNFSNHGIQRIELFESEDAFIKQNPTRIIALTDCVKVSPAPQKHQPNVFEVRTKNNAFQFSADTFQDMSDWLTCLQSVAFGKLVPKLSPAVTKEEKHEENLLYSSVDEPEIFPVKAVSTEATTRNKLIGDYKLIITPVNLSVAEECSQGRMGRILFTWPYRHIRRYGCTTENFSFEAGRKCTSGEGLFTFSTNDGMLIFQSVDAHVLTLKSSQNESDIPSSPSVNEDKYFFASHDSLFSKKDSSHIPASKQDQSSCVGNSNDNETTPFQNKSTVKSTAPLAKPPRKGKSSKSACLPSSPNISHAKDAPNVYEELFKGSHSDLASDSSGLPYSAYDSYEDQSIGKLSDSAVCYSLEKLHICDTSKQKELPSYDYENCDPFLQTNSADHVYGKLLNTRQSLPSKESCNRYGTIIPKQNSATENLSSPVYSNVPFFQKSCSNINIPNDIRRDPDHFVKNDAEYAQVFKKNENSSFL